MSAKETANTASTKEVLAAIIAKLEILAVEFIATQAALIESGTLKPQSVSRLLIVSEKELHEQFSSLRDLVASLPDEVPQAIRN